MSHGFPHDSFSTLAIDASRSCPKCLHPVYNWAFDASSSSFRADDAMQGPPPFVRRAPKDVEVKRALLNPKLAVEEVSKGIFDAISPKPSGVLEMSSCQGGPSNHKRHD